MPASPADKHFQIEVRGRILIVEFLSPRLYEHLVLNEVDDELRAAVADYQPQHVVFHFGKVDFCSTSIINGLLRVRRKMHRRGGAVAICELRPEVAKAFKVLNLDSTVFVTANTVEEAVRSLEDDTTGADTNEGG